MILLQLACLVQENKYQAPTEKKKGPNNPTELFMKDTLTIYKETQIMEELFTGEI